MEIHPDNFLTTAKVLAAAHNNRAKLRGNEGWITEHDVILLFERAGGICELCCKSARLYIDHIISLCNGGCNTVSNLQMIRRACHIAKEEVWVYPKANPKLQKQEEVLEYRTKFLRDMDAHYAAAGGLEGQYRRHVNGGFTRKQIAKTFNMKVPALARWVTLWNKAKKEQESGTDNP